MTYTTEQIKKAILDKNFVFFEADHKPYNFNMVAIRNKDRVTQEFNDSLYFIWKYNGKYTSVNFKVTTDPGYSSRLNPLNPNGSAIIAEGQYRSAYIIGFHKGDTKRKCLVQRGKNPIKVYRDNNKDSILDLEPETIMEGYVGCNIHDSGFDVERTQVNNWSHGCIVFARPWEFTSYQFLIERASEEWGPFFTLTLLEQETLENYV